MHRIFIVSLWVCTVHHKKPVLSHWEHVKDWNSVLVKEYHFLDKSVSKPLPDIIAPVLTCKCVLNCGDGQVRNWLTTVPIVCVVQHTITMCWYINFIQLWQVARIQLSILESLQLLPASAEGVDEARNALNAGLKDITTLYGDFAEVFHLAECKLAIVHCAGHYDPTLICSLWRDIINTGK